MPLGGILSGLFGGGEAGGGGQVQAPAAQQQQLANNAVFNVVIGNQQAFGRGPAHNPWDQDAIQYGYQRAPAPRPRDVNAVQSIYNAANSFTMEGLKFTEIVVSRDTLLRLQGQMAPIARFNPQNGDLLPNDDREVNMATPMGIVKFVCADDRPKFDLTKYMETVD